MLLRTIQLIDLSIQLHQHNRASTTNYLSVYLDEPLPVYNLITNQFTVYCILKKLPYTIFIKRTTYSNRAVIHVNQK